MSEMEIPKGWNNEKLSSILESRLQGLYYNQGYFTEGTHLLRISDMTDNGKINYATIPKIHIEKKEIERFRLQKGDIVIARTGGAGRTAIFEDDEFESVFAGYLIRFRFKSVVDPYFMNYFLRSPVTQSRLLGSRHGGVMKNINAQNILDLDVFFPSLQIQKKIVQKLDEVLGKLEEKKKEILSLIEQNKERINFFNKNWFSYIIDTKIQKYPNQQKWISKSVEELFYIKGRIGWKGLKKSDRINSGPFLVTGVDFKDGQINWQKCFHIPMEKFLESPEIMLQQDDVLLTKDGTIGKIAYVNKIPNGKASLNAHIALIRNKENNGIHSKYIFYLLNSNYFRSFAKHTQYGATRPSLTQKSFKKFIVPVPSLSIQKEIIQNIENAEEKFKLQKTQFKNIIQNYESRIKYINHIQSSILNSAFSGKLVI